MNISKRENASVDFFKLFCSILIVALHIITYNSIKNPVAFGIAEMICRIAVPFFFVASGYFAAEIFSDMKRIYKYIWRLVTLYILYVILNLPIIIPTYINIQHGLLFFIKDFFFVGFHQLWYFIGLIQAILMLSILIKYFKINTLLCVSIILYVMGMIGNIFPNELMTLPGIGLVIKIYFFVFSTTRNGIFMGFLFVLVGYCIKKEVIFSKEKFKFKYCIIACLFFMLETVFYWKFSQSRNIDIHLDMTISLVPVIITMSILVFYAKIDCRINAKILRNISTLIFAFHLEIMYFIKNISHFLGYKEVNVLILFCLTTLCSIILSILIIALSEKRLKWLKYLY